MLTLEQKEIINKTLSHPAFNFCDSNGNQFYTYDKLEILYEAIEILLSKMNSLYVDLPIPDRIENIITEGIPEIPCHFSSYYSNGIDENTKVFPDDRLPGRTAFGLLCTDDGSNCIGFAETCCILLNLNGYEATPIISKLLKKHQTACHYVTGVIDDQGIVRILDPERKRSCSEPEKNWSLNAYQANLIYAVPDYDFCKEKIGRNGIGPEFLEFTSREGKIAISPMEYIKNNYSQILDQDGRLDLRSQSITPEIQRILKEAISISLTPIYQQSVDMNKQQVSIRRSA